MANHKKSPPPRGRPLRHLDTGTIFNLANCGYTNSAIARELGCARGTLRRYAAALEAGRTAARARHRLALFQAATAGGSRKALAQLVGTLSWPQPRSDAGTHAPTTGRQRPPASPRVRSDKSLNLAARQEAMKRRWRGRSRGGRPSTRIDRNVVKYLAFLGYTDAAIARQVKCDPRTLRGHCQALLRDIRRVLPVDYHIYEENNHA